MDSPLGLLVVGILGLYFVCVQGCPLSPNPAGTQDFVPNKTIEDIKTLIAHLNLADNKLVGTVFNMTALDGKLEHEQWLFLNATLDVYLNIFSNMLNEERLEEVNQSLQNLRNKMQELKRHYYSDRIKTKIQKLAAIETTDAVVQKKALNEFQEVFQRASKLGASLHQRACTQS
uniref:Interferon gamma n=1 Tax=Esox lucius TaxID=8010 RepID=A0A3P8Y9A6_ESOLU